MQGIVRYGPNAGKFDYCSKANGQHAHDVSKDPLVHNYLTLYLVSSI